MVSDARFAPLSRRLFLAGAAACLAGRRAWAQRPVEPERLSVTSADGTVISYLRIGAGSKSLVIAPGGLDIADDWLAVAALMADRVTCFPMNRRSRGASGPHRAGHSIDQEVEDILAVMEAAGPGAALLGHSSGGVFALETALRANIETLVLYEPAIPYGTPISSEVAAQQMEGLNRALELTEARDLDAALELALDIAGASEAEVAEMRATPMWPVLTTRTRAWLGDMEAMSGLSSDADRLRALGSRTLLVMGEVSPVFLRDTIAVLDATLRDARVLVLPGQGHTANIAVPVPNVGGNGPEQGPGLLAKGLTSFLA